MILHRTSNHKRRASLLFLTTSNQQKALLSRLEKKNWIEEVFERPLPIPSVFQTRFGPPGFMTNVFYASEKRETTFFEYAYGLLKRSSLFGRSISAVCFEVKFQNRKEPIEVSREGNFKAILDPNTYLPAQKWLLMQKTIPESVRYPSVRQPDGLGINFAIYERYTILATSSENEDLILTPFSNGSVEFESMSRGSLPTITPRI